MWSKIVFLWIICAVSALKIKHDKLCNQLSSAPILQQVTVPVDHSEGPSWDSRTNSLYYVDIHSGNVHNWNFDSGKDIYINLNGSVTPVVQSKDLGVVFVGVDRSVVAVEWDLQNETKGDQQNLTTVSPDYPTSRFNDGKADSEGRLWWGTMGYEDSAGTLTPNQGIFYKITSENIEKPEVMLNPVNISNGLAWNKANTILYYIDTPTNQIAAFDFDAKSGKIENRTIVFDLNKFPNISGHPDGMTIDENDNLWICLYGGGSILHVNPKTGELLQQIAIPAENVTSAMFGGPNLDILFVTTSRFTLTLEEKKRQPSAGAVFALSNLGTKGLPVFQADLKTDLKRHHVKW